MSCKKCKTSKCTCEATICINPLIYMIKNALSLEGTASSDYGIQNGLVNISDKCSQPVSFSECEEFILSLPEALYGILTKGFIISNNKEYCCPDCKTGIYFLGDTDNYLQTLQTCPNLFCCVEKYVSIDNYLKATEAIGYSKFKSEVGPININTSLSNNKCCDTDFSSALQEWISLADSSSDYFFLDLLLDTGIFESSSFNKYSGLGILLNYLKLNHPELTGKDYLDILGVIAKLGVVVRCDGCEMIISSADSFANYAEGIGLCGGAAVPA